MDDILEWSREVINSLMKKNNISVGLPYRVKVTYSPNPLDFDGIDEVIIEVIRVYKIASFTKEEVLYSTAKEYCFNLVEAMKKVNKFVATQIK